MNEHTVWFCTAVLLVLLVSLVFMAHLVLPMISGSATRGGLPAIRWP
jgi:hypothetical protein